MSLRLTRLVVILLALPMAWATISCRGGSPPPEIVISSPVHGSFSTAASVVASGSVNVPAANALLEVNGVTVPVQPDGTWSTTIALDQNVVFNPINVRVTRLSDGLKGYGRVTVIAGDSVADGALSPESIAMRLNDSGLDTLEPVITSLVNLDLATLLPPGTLVIDNYCYLDSIFGCIGRVDVTVAGSPPPAIGSFGIDIDSRTNSADADVQLNNLFVRANVDDATGVPLHCTIDINATTSNIDGSYTLDPSAIDPSNIDVAQLGLVNLTFGGFSDNTNCSGLLGGLVEALIGLFIGDIQDLVEPAMEDFLNTPDANGNTPIAGAVETALADITITGPISESLGVLLEAPLFEVAEDEDGITLGSDGGVTADFPGPGACVKPPDAPDLQASLSVDEAFPAFGATTPVSGLPYGLGLALSTSAFNQLLKAETECGLLRVDLTELDLGIGGGPTPINAELMSLFIPELGGLDPATPMMISIRPTLAPALTGNSGPNGELGELRAGHITAALVGTSAPFEGRDFLKAAFEFRGGFDVAFASGALAFNIGAITAGDVNVDLIDNWVNTDELAFTNVLNALLPLLLPQLAGSLGSFPLPDFLGLSLQSVEVSKNGEFLTLFTDLVPSP
jgi:hypothetical protein